MDMEDAYSKLEASLLSEKPVHVGFVNSLHVDCSGEFLLAGCADSSISIWSTPSKSMAAHIPRHTEHNFGVSRAMWWPEDASAFVSGSFDSCVSLWDSEQLETVYTFNMENKVYNLDIEMKGSTALVAVGMDHPMIRIIDLKSGGASHTLKGHQGRVTSVKWCPNNPNILASAGSDGTVRVWDIRRSDAWVASMDMARTAATQELQPLDLRRAHRSSVNGLTWTPLGTCLISLGNDNKARVWDLSVPGGINENVNFGPLVQNRRLQTLDPVLSPSGDLKYGYIFIPSDTSDILLFDIMQGRLIKRIRPPAGQQDSRQACITTGKPGSCVFYTGNRNGRILEISPANIDT